MQIDSEATGDSDGIDLKSYLAQVNSSAVIHEFSRSTRTVEEATEQVNIGKDEILKTIVMICDESTPLLAFVLGNSRVSYKKVKQILGAKRVRLASPQEVRDVTGFDAGTVPPIGHKAPIKALIDRSAAESKIVIAGGGKFNQLLTIHVREIMRLVKPKVVDLCSHQPAIV